MTPWISTMSCMPGAGENDADLPSVHPAKEPVEIPLHDVTDMCGFRDPVSLAGINDILHLHSIVSQGAIDLRIMVDVHGADLQEARRSNLFKPGPGRVLCIVLWHFPRRAAE